MVLVVEDDPSIRELVTLTLEDAGYQVREAANGRAALHECGLSPIDLILLDMRMPVMDGWAFAREYKATEVRHAPIVVLTAAEDAAARAAQIDANAYLGKPFDLNQLTTIVGRYVRPANN